MHVGALWKKQKEDGTQYMLGKTGPVIIPQGSTMAIIKNPNKKSEKSPDYFVEVWEPMKEQVKPETTIDNGDIPF
jgi:uncharacterized protein (DUF736 family)